MTYSGGDTTLFESISNDIAEKGYSIRPYALPEDLTRLLLNHLIELPTEKFKRAGIGRAKDHMINDFIRTDEISWIARNNEASCAWINWTESLQAYLNRRLFLGLFSFESHFAHYAKGDFYKKHKDAFKGEGNRVLSVVVYLNQHWSADDGGELVIYDKNSRGSTVIDNSKITVLPSYGTIVVFLSEEFPHEVLPAKRDRYSIAGWFRLNNSIDNNIDPPS
ncbi:2OG-Fe(II) oxygenase [Colwellia hornerae]|uniref:2OG-Fe(II) oxygenase n=1 Tax=Colwellia hornerae TaxID=89402 RepID=A0A5C6Q8B0_9GAMM|nr:2OG-Fe(II) oxygenase [Colwellia hornerae]TWX57590.1 2OG-Fe(II) oxygenase [Colwellia hornerae]TWX64942.1 2OG-Fe(II) oxygenase [Colwellia hornerae]